MERVQRVIREVAPHDSVERYTGLGVDMIEGTAKITSPWSVAVTTAEGARPNRRQPLPKLRFEENRP